MAADEAEAMGLGRAAFEALASEVLVTDGRTLDVDHWGFEVARAPERVGVVRVLEAMTELQGDPVPDGQGLKM